jgi:enoyl-CoA hydratase
VSAPVTSRVEGTTGIVELSRPKKFNCLSVEVHEAIDAARQAFEADRAVRAILLRAQGKHFCTGADLAQVKSVIRNADDLDHFIGCGLAVLSRLEASPLPVVVAVQGLCLAGGIELMLAADICFAAETAQFGDQHATFGLVPGWGGSQRLTRIIGLRRTLDLLYSARWMKAEEAHTMGLVNYVVPDEKLHEEALAYCQAFATRSRPGIAEMKRLARQGADLTLEQSMRLERDAAVRHLQGADGAEGIASFDERRTPRFTQ